MADVFVSYASDDEERARLVAKALEAEGLSVWWDPALKPGESVRSVIRQAIAAAQAVVVLWTAQSVESHWVCAEAEEGRERGILVPLLMEEGVEPPFGFGLIHAARLHDWNGQPTHDEWEDVVDQVRKYVGRPAEVTGGRTKTRRRQHGALHRLRSRIDEASQAVSYVGALVTLFQAAVRWEDTVNLVADHAVAALIFLLGLAALFASSLLQNLRLGRFRWRPRTSRRESDRPPSPAMPPVERRPQWKRAVMMGGSLATALALGVVVVLLYLSTTGVHYVLLESAATYDRAAQRAGEVNRLFEISGEVARARANGPHFSNPNSAILVGPYFSRSAAQDALERLRRNSEYRVRSDAIVMSYSIKDAKEVVARFLGWKPS